LQACRIILDREPASGAWNMSVDEALLESAVAGGPCTVRWYQWDQATLSIGYFQRLDELHNDARLSRLPVVRRLSGGGAVVHDKELTYSCTLPAWHPLARDARELYSAVHGRIIEILAESSFRATLRGETADPGRSKAFLCFGRGDDFDVVMEGHKVLGSAQRRRKGAVLQHGSLVLRRSEWAPEFPGIFDCAGRAVPEADLVARLSRAVGTLFASRLEHCSLAMAEHDRAARLAERSA
jgi:lipoyl(octanoyl) transferase